MKYFKYIALFLLLANTAFAQTSTANQNALSPIQPGPTLTISVTTSASGGQSVGATFPGGATTAQVMVTNIGSNACFVAFGSSTSVSATTSSTPVPAGAVEVFTITPYTKYVSAITSTSTTTCYFTVGVGN